MENKNSTVLLIGGAGYVGSVVTQHLLEMGYVVRCFDNLIYNNHAAPESFFGTQTMILNTVTYAIQLH